MKIIRNQKWTPVIYRESLVQEFDFWTSTMRGKGDQEARPSPKNAFLRWMRKWGWSKYVVFQVQVSAEEEVLLRPGFMSAFGDCKLSSAVIKATPDNNLFAMRMGREDCEFFFVCNKSVKVNVAGYIRRDLALY